MTSTPSHSSFPSTSNFNDVSGFVNALHNQQNVQKEDGRMPKKELMLRTGGVGGGGRANCAENNREEEEDDDEIQVLEEERPPTSNSIVVRSFNSFLYFENFQRTPSTANSEVLPTLFANNQSSPQTDEKYNGENILREIGGIYHRIFSGLFLIKTFHRNRNPSWQSSDDHYNARKTGWYARRELCFGGAIPKTKCSEGGSWYCGRVKNATPSNALANIGSAATTTDTTTLGYSISANFIDFCCLCFSFVTTTTTTNCTNPIFKKQDFQYCFGGIAEETGPYPAGS